jgi:hypothetical protein
MLSRILSTAGIPRDWRRRVQIAAAVINRINLLSFHHN